jgi:hypothetical protein
MDTRQHGYIIRVEPACTNRDGTPIEGFWTRHYGYARNAWREAARLANVYAYREPRTGEPRSIATITVVRFA